MTKPLIQPARARDMTAYRNSQREQARTSDLLRLTPRHGHTALDIGARDGHMSKLLADRYDTVVALDLTRPAIEHPRVTPVQGDACNLPFENHAFDLVVCCEVLEHIPPPMLQRVCDEIVRVAGQTVLIGVPYKQDLRFGRTTCAACGGYSPPWGHVNSFDEGRLRAMFGALAVKEVSFVGSTRDATSAPAAALMNFAGNPYGTYSQEEGCIHCGASMVTPSMRTLPQKIATKAAMLANGFQRTGTTPRGNWIHILFAKHLAA